MSKHCFDRHFEINNFSKKLVTLDQHWKFNKEVSEPTNQEAKIQSVNIPKARKRVLTIQELKNHKEALRNRQVEDLELKIRCCSNPNDSFDNEQEIQRQSHLTSIKVISALRYVNWSKDK